MSVSVVMATYNGEVYIREQLDSICKQLASEDEIVICDDCSKDETVRVIQEYIDENNLQHLIKLHINEHNLGFQNNFNKALMLADADYIFFADQDDIWCENKIQDMLEILKSTPDCQLLCCDYEPFVCTSDAPTPPKSLRKKMPNNGVLEKVALNHKNMYIGALGCCMGMKRQFREAIRQYWYEGWAQDDRCWRMALCTNGLYILHSNLVLHRLHGNNTATFGKYHLPEKRIALFKGMYQADLQMMKYLKANNPDAKQLQLIRKNAEMFRLRIELLEQHKWMNMLLLLKYLGCYQATKSYLVEGWMNIKFLLKG